MVPPAFAAGILHQSVPAPRARRVAVRFGDEASQNRAAALGDLPRAIPL